MMKMALETFPWDPVDHLQSTEDMISYLEAAFEDGDPDLIAVAIQDVARAKGLVDTASLSANSDIGSLVRAIKALGLELAPKLAA